MENPEHILQMPIDNIIVEPVVELTPDQKIKELEAQLEALKTLVVEPIVEPVIDNPFIEPIVVPIMEEPDVLPMIELLTESEIPTESDESHMSINEPETIPNVIHNSDVLYKSNIQWANNIEYIEPNNYEIAMLHGTKKPHEILEEEKEEVIVIKSEEEIKKQRTKDLLLIFKVVSLNRLGHHPIHNTSYLQPIQLKEFLDMMNSIITNEFDQGLELQIRDEFNKICNDKLFSSKCDISQYPVYA